MSPDLEQLEVSVNHELPLISVAEPHLGAKMSRPHCFFLQFICILEMHHESPSVMSLSCTEALALDCATVPCIAALGTICSGKMVDCMS